MILYIKNMVCNRCRSAVEQIFKESGLQTLRVALGEVELEEKDITPEQRRAISTALNDAGFEILDDRNSRLLEQIKNLIIGWVHHSEAPPKLKYSEHISAALHHDYSFLSRLFSQQEGITIEQYLIQQKIERVKELMVYNQRSLSQIAFDLSYSSVAHLSAQFKKVTGLTPTQFKSLQEKGRKSLDEVGRSK